MKKLSYVAAVMFLALVALPVAVQSQAQPKKKTATPHATMQKDHEAAEADHSKWESDIATWRVEHLRALATLAEVQAKILRHDAALLEHAEHIRLHEEHAELRACKVFCVTRPGTGQAISFLRPGSRSSNRMAKWLRAAFQPRIGSVHRFEASWMAR